MKFPISRVETFKLDLTFLECSQASNIQGRIEELDRVLSRKRFPRLEKFTLTTLFYSAHNANTLLAPGWPDCPTILGNEEKYGNHDSRAQNRMCRAVGRRDFDCQMWWDPKERRTW